MQLKISPKFQLLKKIKVYFSHAISDVEWAVLPHFKLYCVEYITSREPGIEVEYIISTYILLAKYCDVVANCKGGWEMQSSSAPKKIRIVLNLYNLCHIYQVWKAFRCSALCGGLHLTSQLAGDLGFFKCSLKSDLWSVKIKPSGMSILGLYEFVLFVSSCL